MKNQLISVQKTFSFSVPLVTWIKNAQAPCAEVCPSTEIHDKD